SFLFPLLLIGFYAFADRFAKEAPRLFSVACLGGGAALLLGAVFLVPRIAFYHGDCPDAFWLELNVFDPQRTDGFQWLYVVVSGSLAVLALFALFRSALPHLYSAFFLAAVLVGTWQNYRINQLVASGFEDDVRAAQVLNSLLTPSEIENGVIISPASIDERFAVLIALNAMPQELARDTQSELNFEELPPKTLWVALKGDYRFAPPAGVSIIQCPGWQLILFTPRTAAADAPV